ncbi:conserved hypothetical protein [Vibrio chagasii]|nr:conserved hypothetical protein [Vibrio chagasii]
MEHKRPFRRTRNAITLLEEIREEEPNKFKPALDGIKELISICENSNPSTRPNYDKLEEWEKPIYDFISSKLKDSGFINADKEHNNKSPLIMLWWNIHGYLPFIVKSSFMEPHDPIHHASAYSRNNAVIKELSVLLKAYEEQ